MRVVTLLSTIMIVAVSCATNNTLDKSTLETITGEYISVRERFDFNKRKVIIMSNGQFSISPIGRQCYSLNRPSNMNEGSWKLKNGKLYLSTYYQGTLKDHLQIVDKPVSKDSIELTLFSIYTGKPLQEEIVILSDTVVYSDTNGLVKLPNRYVADLETKIHYESYVIFGDGRHEKVQLNAGTAYEFYVLDCLKLKLKNEQFRVEKDGLRWVSSGEFYKKQPPASKE